MHLAREDRVEGVHIEDGFNVLATVREFEDLLLDVAAERVGIEKGELAIAAPDQGGLRSDVDDAANLERSANVPEVV